jgi:hypothetical protein
MPKAMFTVWVALTIAAYTGVARSQAPFPYQKLSGSDNETHTAPLTPEVVRSDLAKLRDILAAVDELPTKDAGWVELTTDSPKNETRYHGWRLHESAGEIQLLAEHGRKETFDKRKLAAKKPAADFQWTDVRIIRESNFERFCRESLVEKKKVEDNTKDDGVYRFQRELDEANAAIIDFARWACWADAKGNSDLARQLLQKAADKLQQRNATYVGMPAGDKLPAFVAERSYPQAADSSDWTTTKDDPNEMRRHLLRSNQALAKIPYRPDHEAIVRRVQQLASLIAEDKVWKEPAKEELSKMDVKGKAAYWLYHLRNLNVTQTSDPGMCRVVTDSPWFFLESQDLSPKGTANPAVELKKLGYDALPQIIEHLDDGRPTRCVGFWRSYAPDSYYTLTYGDCCQQIFEAVTGRSIYDRGYSNGYPIKDGKGPECKAAAQRWWQAYQRGGEKGVLIEGVEAGNFDSDGQARRLLAKYPEAAPEPIIRSAHKHNKASLLDLAGDITGDRLLPEFRAELGSSDCDMRIAAAWALTKHSQEEGVRGLLKEWQAVPWEQPMHSTEQDRVSRLVSYLACCGEPRAIQTLSSGFEQIPPAVQSKIISACEDIQQDCRARPLSAAVQTAMEDLLALALRNTEQCPFRWSSGDKSSRADTMIADLAAKALVRRWGKPQLFDIYATYGSRDRQRIEVKNVWLKKRGKPPIPLRPTITQLPDSRVRPLLEAVQRATTPEARHESICAVEKLGLAALPAMHGYLPNLKLNDPAHAPLERSVRQMSLTIGQVQFTEDSVSPNDEVRQRAEALRSVPITSERLMEFLFVTADKLPRGARGVRMTVEREGDDSGATASITLIADRPGQKKRPRELTVRKAIFLGRETVLDASFGCFRGELSSPDLGWSEFANRLAVSLQSPPGQYLLVQIGWEEER